MGLIDFSLKANLRLEQLGHVSGGGDLVNLQLLELLPRLGNRLPELKKLEGFLFDAWL